jgi:hypothetical protein
MAIQVFTAGQILTAAQMNTLTTTTARYNAIGSRTTSLSITNSGNSSVVDTTNFSGTITATTGDLLQATFTGDLAAGTNIAHYNFYTFNGATAVNPFIAPNTFNPFFYAATFVGNTNFVALYKVVAGDIFTSQVTVKLTCNTAGAARTVSSASVPSSFTVTNLGQVQ